MAQTESIIRVLRLPPLPSIRDILNLYNLRATKRLSQNFLMQEKVINKIVKAAGNIRGKYVCEVGPGPGGITRSIIAKGARELTVIEKDERFNPCLELLADACEGRMKIINGDILKTDLSTIFPNEAKRKWDVAPPPIHMIGNLPFNISTPLIIRWLRSMSERSGLFLFGRVPLTLTFQKEVAERMVAQPYDKQRCRLSVMCQYLTEVEHKLNIPGSACVPKPEVDIGVVHFKPLVDPLIKQPFQLVEKFMRHLFHFRQKYCRRGVETLFPDNLQDELTRELFPRSDVDLTKKCIELSMEEIRRMTDVYCDICARIPNLSSYEYRVNESVEEWKDFKITKGNQSDD